MSLSKKQNIYTALLNALISLLVSCYCGGNNPVYYSLELRAENGTVSAEPDLNKYLTGTRVTLSAAANNGYEFSEWAGDEECSENPFSFIMNSDKNITCRFVPYYTLNVHAFNGAVSIEPLLERYPAGSEVTLSATSDDGYDFFEWEGNEQSMENPFKFVMNSNKSITAVFVLYYRANYYVDFESGDDSDDGLSPAAAWKHAPGDPQAAGTPAAVNLQPGNSVLFKGGAIYRGHIDIPADGAFNHHVTYQGDAWPGIEGTKAIIDGGAAVTGWLPCPSAAACEDNPNWANMHYAYLPADIDPLSINLHEYNTTASEDEFLWPAQDPDPADFYFYDDRDSFRTITQANLTRTSITDPAYFNQAGSTYWDDSYLLIWINPNIVVTRKILSFIPAENRVTFSDLGQYAIYPNGRDQAYAIFNSPHAIDDAGEYFIATTPDVNGLRILLWPRNSTDLDSRITYSVRSYGFDINARSNITIEGFKIIKHCGSGLRDGVGIGTISASHLPSYNLIIRNNLITHNRKGGSDPGYGGIFLGSSYSTLVQDNEVIYNPRQAGIFFGSGARITAKNNIMIRPGGTSLRMYGVHHGIMDGNIITECNGSHANGITLYLGCRDILVANNRVQDSGSPVTFQDSGNLWFINNVIDAYERESNVNEWGDTGHGPWERGVIAFFNNTLVRNSRNAALNIGGASDENTYISINNIIDGGGGAESIERRHNLYTGLAWSQEDPRYGWDYADGEFLQADLSLIFTDPAAYDYSLLTGSPAIGAGDDVSSYYPTDIFPDFDFTRDIDGHIRTGRDIGAHAY